MAAKAGRIQLPRGGQRDGEVVGPEPADPAALQRMTSQLPTDDAAVKDQRIQGDAGETEPQAVEHGDEAHRLDVHPRLLQDLLDRHLGRGVADVGPPRRVQPHAGVGPLHEEDLAAVVPDDRPDRHLGRGVAGDTDSHLGQPLLDEDGGRLGVGTRRHPDVGGHPEDLLEPLTLVEVVAEAEPGAGDAGQRFAPPQQIVRRGLGSSQCALPVLGRRRGRSPNRHPICEDNRP